MNDNHPTPDLLASLQERVVVVFGGTSGIGLAAAIQAREAGADVIVIGRDPGKASRAAQEHGFAGWRQADVTDGASVAAALDDIERVDHLVLLAGSFVAGKVMEADIGHLQRAFDERMWAAVHAIRALGKRLASDGSIILISGALADRPTAQGTAVLAAASAAMEAFARGLALELAPIRVNTLSPGPVETPLLDKVLGEARERVLPIMRAASPLKRLGSAEEASAAVVFLMANGWMNGSTLHVDGGSRLA